MSLERSQLVVEVFQFRAGARDFVIRRQIGGDVQDINPMELLGLPEAARIIDRFASQQPSLALIFALARLLVPCLEYRGNRRHLVVEEWTDADFRGEALYAGTRTDMLAISLRNRPNNTALSRPANRLRWVVSRKYSGTLIRSCLGCQRI